MLLFLLQFLFQRSRMFLMSQSLEWKNSLDFLGRFLNHMYIQEFQMNIMILFQCRTHDAFIGYFLLEQGPSVAALLINLLIYQLLSHLLHSSLYLFLFILILPILPYQKFFHLLNSILYLFFLVLMILPDQKFLIVHRCVFFVLRVSPVFLVSEFQCQQLTSPLIISP